MTKGRHCDPLAEMYRSVSVMAVMATRNEAGYIELALQSLIAEGIEVVLIDNGSIDGTPELAASFLGRGLLRVMHLRYRGRFDLGEQLAVKREVFAAAPHDWLMHADADEWFRAGQDQTVAELLDSIEPRHLVVNFDEFVFLPPSGVDMWGMDYRQVATEYYHFKPVPYPRLCRVWRAGYDLENSKGGGHTIAGLDQGDIYPHSQVMRHYVGLSWSHAIGKRSNRSYPEAEVAMGWHRNRMNMRAATRRRSVPHLKVANPWDTRDLDRSAPSRFHFWEEGFGSVE